MSRGNNQRDPWVAIVRAGRAGRGVHLTADEVERLLADDAILSAAETCATECVCDVMRFSAQCAWCDDDDDDDPSINTPSSR